MLQCRRARATAWTPLLQVSETPPVQVATVINRLAIDRSRSKTFAEAMNVLVVFEPLCLAGCQHTAYLALDIIDVI